MISIVLPAYSVLNELLRSIRSNSTGLLLGPLQYGYENRICRATLNHKCCMFYVDDSVTEITTKNRLKDRLSLVSESVSDH